MNLNLEALNQGAVFSVFSGQPVVFVSKITRGMRRAGDGVYSDGNTVYDGFAKEEGDISSMFAVTDDGNAASLTDLMAQMKSRSPEEFYEALIPRLANREDVEITPGSDDEDIDEEDEDSLDVYSREGYDTYSGIAVSVEDAAPAEVMVRLIEKFGIDAREFLIEFMFTAFENEGKRITEVFYRFSVGDCWIRAFMVMDVPEEDLDDFIHDAIPDVLQNEIDWDRLIDSVKIEEDEPEDEEFSGREKKTGQPEIREGGKVLRPFRRQ